MAGFGFSETLTGTWARVSRPAEALRFQFSVVVRTGPIKRFRVDHAATITGTVDAAGLATKRDLAGTMVISPFARRVIRYEFAFNGDDQQSYRFSGQKNIRWLDPFRTWSELPGQLIDGGGVTVGRVAVKFNLRRDIIPFLRSVGTA